MEFLEGVNGRGDCDAHHFDLQVGEKWRAKVEASTHRPLPPFPSTHTLNPKPLLSPNPKPEPEPQTLLSINP